MPRKSENIEFLARPENSRLRALQRAMGYDPEDLKRPRIGIANTWAETSPGHVHLRSVADSVKAGVWQAGGVPFEFNSFAQCPMAVGEHGIRYDTPTRDIIAAEVEASTRLHLFDALVMISSCDKNVPAHLLAAARLNLPTIIVPGGPMDSGRYQGADMDTTNLDSECWSYGVGKPAISLDELNALEDKVCPGAGSCALLGTANTMQCLSEALGMTLPKAGTALAVSAERLWLAKASGRRIVRLWEENITARSIMNPAALKNAVSVLHAIGGSTNAVMHLMALAYELDIEKEINMGLVESIGQTTPCIAAVRPSGPYTMRDFHESGGVPVVMKTISQSLDQTARTVSGFTLGQLLEETPEPSGPAIKPLSDPVSTEGLAILKGSLADYAVVRPTVVSPEMRRHRGPARVFDSQEEALSFLQNGGLKPGNILVVRFEGPRGGPGLTEVFKVIGYLKALGLEDKCALITDGKISGFAKGPFICQVSPEAADRGPLAVVRDGDEIEIDIPGRRLDLLISEDELNSRLAQWTPAEPRVKEGVLTLYARLGLPAYRGGGLDLRLK